MTKAEVLQEMFKASSEIRSPVLWRADLRYVDLRGLLLRYAYLREANLEGADLRGTNLLEVNLCHANLKGADLCGANLRNANLQGVNLKNTTGNGKEIKTIQTDRWTVAYTAKVMQIGCEQHAIEDWWDFDDTTISGMESTALEWWLRWKPVLHHIIGISPGVPTNNKEEK